MKYDKGTEISGTGCSYKIYVNRCPGQRDIWKKYYGISWSLFKSQRIHTEEGTSKCLKCKTSFSHNLRLSDMRINQHWTKIWRKSSFISSNIHELHLQSSEIESEVQGQRHCSLSFFFLWVTGEFKIYIFSLVTVRTSQKQCWYSYRKIFIFLIFLLLLLSPHPLVLLSSL